MKKTLGILLLLLLVLGCGKTEQAGKLDAESDGNQAQPQKTATTDKQVASPAAKAPANKAVAAKTPDAATVKEPDPKPDKPRFSPVGHNRNLLLTLKGHTDGVECVTFSPDGKRIASSGYDRTVKVWDSETGEEKLTIKKAHSREITTVLFSPDGKRILTQSRFANKRIKVWDAKTGQQLLANTDYGYNADCAALSPDDKLIAMGDLSGIRVCDSKTGEEVLVLKASGWKCVGFSPDGKWIVVGHGSQIRVWDVETGEMHKFYGGHTDEISDVEFSPDGKRIASSSDDGAKPIKVWDFETGKELFTLEISDPNNVSFSSDGKRIVSSGYSTIKVWDSKTGKIILTLRPNDQEGRGGNPKMCVAISPDGNRIVSGGHDDPGEGDIVKVWNISGIKPGSKPKADKPPAQDADADSVVEKAIRRELKKPEGEITKADLEKVTELNFALAGTKITDAVLKEVAKCKQLKLLNFNAGQITAEGLKEVAKLQKLETLGLSSTGVTDAGLKEVAKCTQLTFLNLMNTKITDAGLREVMKLKKLNDLTLAYNNITGAGLKELANLNQLRHLWLDGTKVTKADVTELQKALPKCSITGP